MHSGVGRTRFQTWRLDRWHRSSLARLAALCVTWELHQQPGRWNGGRGEGIQCGIEPGESGLGQRRGRCACTHPGRRSDDMRQGTKMRGFVVITGCSTGIGEAAAQHLASRGYHVFAGVRRAQDAERLERHVIGRCTPLILDVTDQGSIERAFRAIDEEVGDSGIQGIVNNAGVAKGGPLEFLDMEVWRDQFEVNFFGLISVTKAAMPLIRKGGGRVVLVGSTSGRVATPLMGPYTSSKFAVEGLADSLRLELAPSGIHVSVIEPGAIRTAIWEKGRQEAARLRSEMPPEAMEHYGELVDSIVKGIEFQDKSAVSPHKVAEAIEHALSSPRPRARYPIGRDAWVSVTASRLLPTRFMDGLISRVVRP